MLRRWLLRKLSPKKWIQELIDERLTEFIIHELDYHVYGALSRRGQDYEAKMQEEYWKGK